MNFDMRVHRISTHPVSVEVVFNGEKALASLPELEVELMSSEGHGTHTLHFRSAADISAAKALFKQGNMVTLTFSQSADAPNVVSTEADPTQAPAA